MSAHEQDGTAAAPGFGPRMRIERDAQGGFQVVPDDSAPYLPPVAAPAAGAGHSQDGEGTPALSDPGTSSGTSSGAGGSWVAWRVTNPEPDAPTWESLSSRERDLWTDGDQGRAEALAGQWERLEAWVAKTVPGCHLKRTPGATGISMIEHTLPWPHGHGTQAYRYPKLPESYARLFAATSPVHRMERFTAEPDGQPVYAYDCRIAYGAHMRHLPVLVDGAEVIHDDGEYIPYRQGRYRVLVTVPPAWHRVGLVPRAPQGAAGQWTWPNTPGEEWETWLDESEMRLIGAGMWNWPHKVLERFLFCDGKTPGADPLRTWATHLHMAIERFDAAPHTPANRAVRYALRAMLIHPVGIWHRSKNAAPPPPFFRTAEEAERWVADAPTDHDLSAFQARWRRPEWAVAIYARTRVEATVRALAATGTLYAIVGDEVRTSAPQPWTDSGRIGAYRRKDGK